MPRYRLKQDWGGFPAGMIIEANSPERCSAMLSGIGELVPSFSEPNLSEGTPTASAPPVTKPESPVKKQVKSGRDKMVRSAKKSK